MNTTSSNNNGDIPGEAWQAALTPHKIAILAGERNFTVFEATVCQEEHGIPLDTILEKLTATTIQNQSVLTRKQVLTILTTLHSRQWVEVSKIPKIEGNEGGRFYKSRADVLLGNLLLARELLRTTTQEFDEKNELPDSLKDSLPLALRKRMSEETESQIIGILLEEDRPYTRPELIEKIKIISKEGVKKLLKRMTLDGSILRTGQGYTVNRSHFMRPFNQAIAWLSAKGGIRIEGDEKE